MLGEVAEGQTECVSGETNITINSSWQNHKTIITISNFIFILLSLLLFFLYCLNILQSALKRIQQQKQHKSIVIKLF